MTPGQTRVVVLLTVLLALEAVRSPAFKAQIVAMGHLASGNVGAAAAAQPTQPFWATSPLSLKQVAYWVIGGVALVALAAPAPDMATLFTVTLLVLVILSDVKDYTALLTPPAKK